MAAVPPANMSCIVAADISVLKRSCSYWEEGSGLRLVLTSSVFLQRQTDCILDQVTFPLGVSLEWHLYLLFPKVRDEWWKVSFLPQGLGLESYESRYTFLRLSFNSKNINLNRLEKLKQTPPKLGLFKWKQSYRWAHCFSVHMQSAYFDILTGYSIRNICINSTVMCSNGKGINKSFILNLFLQ